MMKGQTSDSVSHIVEKLRADHSPKESPDAKFKLVVGQVVTAARSDPRIAALLVEMGNWARSAKPAPGPTRPHQRSSFTTLLSSLYLAAAQDLENVSEAQVTERVRQLLSDPVKMAANFHKSTAAEPNLVPQLVGQVEKLTAQDKPLELKLEQAAGAIVKLKAIAKTG